LDDRVIGVTFDQLKKIPCVVGVAGGLHKLEVVRAALRGGWLDALVTDHHLARCLVADS
jgi:DNA-binding transcriptional regulator LsrR (DeoR family)